MDAKAQEAARGSQPAVQAKLKVLVADDHATMRGVLSSVLSGDSRLEVVAEAGDGQEALELATRLHPDVVVMDFAMPGMDGAEATRRIKERLPGIRVVGLSMFDERGVADRMLQAGAEAFLTKSGPVERLIEAICPLPSS